MKKLSINKLNEYPIISLDEQMMLKGGCNLFAVRKAIEFLALIQGVSTQDMDPSYGNVNGNVSNDNDNITVTITTGFGNVVNVNSNNAKSELETILNSGVPIDSIRTSSRIMIYGIN